VNKIINNIIITFCLSIYTMLAVLFIYAGIDAIGNFGWIKMIITEGIL